jgi:hypothetical protein
MRPLLVSWGSLELSAYETALVAGACLLVWLTVRTATRRGLPRRETALTLMAAYAVGLLGARLLFAVEASASPRQAWATLVRPSVGGYSSLGGLLLGAAAAALGAPGGGRRGPAPPRGCGCPSLVSRTRPPWRSASPAPWGGWVACSRAAVTAPRRTYRGASPIQRDRRRPRCSARECPFIPHRFTRRSRSWCSRGFSPRGRRGFLDPGRSGGSLSSATPSCGS